MIQVEDKITNYIAPYYSLQEYGALEAQFVEWRATRPLLGLSVVDSTPLFRNTLLKYRSLIAAGADITIGLSDMISYNVEVLYFAVNELGLKVASEQGEWDVVLDCAGAFALSKARLGYVELTRSGLGYYEDHDKPVFLADSSRIKQLETELGTGESCFRTLEYLGYSDFAEHGVVIFGSGKVGRGLLREALARGCKPVVVTDPSTADTIYNSVRVIDYRDRDAVHCAIRSAWAVIMATGRKGALSETIDPMVAIDSDALLINMGAEDEFGGGFPLERLLERGRTLNFIMDEPTRLIYIDPTLALHNYGALWVKNNTHCSGVCLPNEQIENQILGASNISLDFC